MEWGVFKMMNKTIPELTKNKIRCFDGRPHINGKHFEDCDMYFTVNDVKLAVRLFKKRIDRLKKENRDGKIGVTPSYKHGFESGLCTAEFEMNNAFKGVID